MKKFITISTTALTSLIMMSSSFAQVSATITINCPVTSGSPTTELRNFANSYIAGTGSESIDLGGEPQTSAIFFKTVASLPAGVPGELSSYSSSSTSFNNDDPANPFVTCSYTSSNSAFPEFSVTYALLNGFGAELTSSTASSIVLNMAVGLKV